MNPPQPLGATIAHGPEPAGPEGSERAAPPADSGTGPGAGPGADTDPGTDTDGGGVTGSPARPRWQLLAPLARPTRTLPAIGQPPRPIEERAVGATVLTLPVPAPAVPPLPRH